MVAMDDTDSQGKMDTTDVGAPIGHASSSAVHMHVSSSSSGGGSDGSDGTASGRRAPDDDSTNVHSNSDANNDADADADGENDGDGGNTPTSEAAIVKADAASSSSLSGNIAKTNIAGPTTSAASVQASPSASPGGKSAKNNATSKSRRPGAVTTLGRDGHDYQHLASPSHAGRHTGNTNEQRQQPRSKWRPPTPERVPHQGKKKRGVGPSARSTAASAGGGSSSLLSNLGGDISHDNTSAPPSSSSSWFGGFFSSSSAPASASAGTTDGSSARFTALDNGTGMHPEQIATDMAIARANRRQQARQQQQQAGMPFHGNKKRSKLIRKGERHLLQQQQQSEDGNDTNRDIDADADGNVLMSQTDMEEAEENFQDELRSDQRPKRTREEQIRDECKFFYTGMDDDPTGKAAELMSRRGRNSRSSSSRFGYRRRNNNGSKGGGGRGLMTTDDDGDYDHQLENGDVRGLYYAASGEDGAMGLDLEAGGGGYYSNNAEERDAARKFECICEAPTITSQAKGKVQRRHPHGCPVWGRSRFEIGPRWSLTRIALLVASIVVCVFIGGIVTSQPCERGWDNATR